MGRARGRTRRLRVPVWVVLLVLVLAPSVGAAALASQEVRRRDEAAAAATRVEHLTEGVVALADLRAALVDEQLYRLADAALGRSDGIDPALVAGVLGRTPGELVESASRSVDEAMSRVADTVVTPAGTTGGRGLSRTRAVAIELAYARHRAARAQVAAHELTLAQASDAMTLLGDAVRDALREMAAHLDEQILGAPRGVGLARSVQSIRRQLELSQVLGLELETATEVVFSGLAGVELDGQVAAPLPRLASLAAQRRLLVEQIGEVLPSSQQALWGEIRADADVQLAEQVIDALVAGKTPPVDVVRGASAGVARLLRYDALLPRLLDDLSAEARGIRAEAGASRRHALGLLVAVLAVTLVLVLVATAAISRPLRRVQRRAGEVRDGDLGAGQARASRVREIGGVDVVFDEIVANLRAVEAQAHLLVRAGADPGGFPALPGAFGRSLRESFVRLAEVTARLQASEALSTAIVESAAEAIWTVDGSGCVRTANAAAVALVGVPAELAIGQRFVLLLDEPHREKATSYAPADELPGVETRIRRVDGTTVPVLLSASRVEAAGELLFTVVARDITERKELEGRLAAQARTDPLTGLPNRRAAVDAIARALSRGGRTGTQAGVVFCDLDGFKQANDVQGHAFGDRLLAAVGQRFAESVRTGETLARLGGDEFVVVLHEVTRAGQATNLAERLLRELHEPFVIDGVRVDISGSFGVVLGDAGAEPLDLLRNADAAMYRAKAAGGGCVRHFDDDVQAEITRRQRVEVGLRRALVHDELVLHFQPVVSPSNGRLVGAEAFVRWLAPDGRLVPAAEFVPVAEESGLVIELDRWVLAEACRRAAAWSADPALASAWVSVNLACAHLTRYDVVGDVETLLAASGLPGERLRLEIPESQLAGDPEQEAAAVRRLHRLGVRVLLDDYGTGHSSIEALRDLPVGGLKIDRTFVARLGGPAGRAVVDAMARLAGALGLETVAEGVETAAELEHVRALGVDLVQGFAIAPPMTGAAFVEWARARTGRVDLGAHTGGP